MDNITQKEQFLQEHNKLSPSNLRATFALLTRFREEKASLFEGDEWPLEKIRRPFIMWLTALPMREKSARASSADEKSPPDKSAFCMVNQEGKKI